MPNKKKIIYGLLATAILGGTFGIISTYFYPSQSPQDINPPKTPSTIITNGTGETFETTIDTEGVGKILLQIELPNSARYEEGAPVLVSVPTYYTPEISGFHPLDEATNQGFISISFMYPGRSDGEGKSSEGKDDFGGENSIKALRDVLLFAMGEKNNSDGNSLAELSSIPPLYSDVGMYAFSHPGIAATQVLGTYPDELKNLAYFVGRENPTLDLLSTLELGHWENQGKTKVPVANKLYKYPEDYFSNSIALDYSSINYDQATNSPYFDTNENSKLDGEEFSLGTQVPRMFGKRYYSFALLSALKSNEIFSTSTWPSDLATPEEGELMWASRETNSYYSKINSGLHVMLIFALKDHVQVVQDKPHIHQAFDGFRSSNIWTRLNPDLSYVAELNPDNTAHYTEHNANEEPSNWATLTDWAYSNTTNYTASVPLAGVVEMADRAYSQNWSEDLTNEIK